MLVIIANLTAVESARRQCGEKRSVNSLTIDRSTGVEDPVKSSSRYGYRVCLFSFKPQDLICLSQLRAC
jgi:hypothetical protein